MDLGHLVLVFASLCIAFALFIKLAFMCIDFNFKSPNSFKKVCVEIVVNCFGLIGSVLGIFLTFCGAILVFADIVAMAAK